MAVLCLRFCARAFSSCGKQGPLFIAVRGPLTIVASRCEHRLQTRRLSNCGSRAQLLRGMWDLPKPGLEPASPALAGRFSTTAPPGKPQFLKRFKNDHKLVKKGFILHKFSYKTKRLYIIMYIICIVYVYISTYTLYMCTVFMLYIYCIYNEHICIRVCTLCIGIKSFNYSLFLLRRQKWSYKCSSPNFWTGIDLV